ncbi:MAG TPA: prolipoprotein diacylglyceryl transferase family protein [Gemmataceae bacterium]|nr:prolipoprotein diacylglyceryl transferase family protein [Gemmataceae bacterium]
MRQVLFEFPVKKIADWFPDLLFFTTPANAFPDLPPLLYLVLAFLAVSMGFYWERRRKEGSWNLRLNLGTAGIVVAIVLMLVCVVKAEPLLADASTDISPPIRLAGNFLKVGSGYLVLITVMIVAGNALEVLAREKSWRMPMNLRTIGVSVVVCLGVIWVLKYVAWVLKYVAHPDDGAGANSIPIYGYGAMLFVAFVFCTWLACWLAAREGIPRERIQDLAIWLFISGIVGARITFMIQYHVPLRDFYRIWEGGLVFYGSAVGGAVGYLFFYLLVLRKYKISSWKLADVVAPCAALGLCLGRFGCLFNGCCYGNVACPDCPSVAFPLAAHPRLVMTEKGYQTDAGFLGGKLLPGTDARYRPQHDTRVTVVEPNSPAWAAGLRPGDKIVEVNGKAVSRTTEVEEALGHSGGAWPRGKNDLILKVQHANGTHETLPPFVPRTIGLHPTQVYESISTALLCALLLAFYPYRRHDGEVMVLFMIGYAVHRFLNEMLRVDTDPVAFGLTLSQNISVLTLVVGLVMGLVLWFRPVQYRPTG